MDCLSKYNRKQLLETQFDLIGCTLLACHVKLYSVAVYLALAVTHNQSVNSVNRLLDHPYRCSFY